MWRIKNWINKLLEKTKTYMEVYCPYDFKSRCTFGKCNCKPR